MTSWFYRIVTVLFMTGALLFVSHSYADDLVEVPEGAFVRVTDTTGTLTVDQKAALMAMSSSLDQSTRAVIITVMVPTIGNESIEQFSMRVAEKLTPGHKGEERAAILVIAKNDKKFRIEVSRALGVSLTDARAHQLTNLMKPFFKSGDFNGAITAFYQNIGPFVQVQDAPTVVETADDSSMFMWVMIGLGSLGIIGTLLWWRSVIAEREAAAERLRRDMEAQLAREAEAERRRRRYNSERVYPGGGLVGAASAATVAASQARRQSTPTKPAPKPAPRQEVRRSRDSDVYVAPVPIFSDDSSSRSSARSNDDSSSRYESSSSPSSYDGGGSSSSWD